MAIEILDSPWDMTPHLPKISAQGGKTIIRYIDHKNSTVLPQKLILPAEAAAIHAAGLKLALVFEQDTRTVGSMTQSEGTKAADRAYSYSTQTLNRPAGRPVYFAVDFDAAHTSDLKAVATYFQAVNTRVAASPGGLAGMPVGVYGSGLVCETLRAAGLATFFWVAQSTGWADYHRFLASQKWHILQGFRKSADGLNFDYDPVFSNAGLPDFGAF